MPNYQVVSEKLGSIWLEARDLAEAREYQAWLNTDGPLSEMETRQVAADRMGARPFVVMVEVHDMTQRPYTWWEIVPEEET
jgi:exonuclease III